MTIEKQYIMNVLHKLIANNCLYKNIENNYCLFNILDNEYIYFDNNNKIVNCKSNYYEYLGYTLDIYKNNYENNFYTAIIDIKIENN